MRDAGEPGTGRRVRSLLERLDARFGPVRKERRAPLDELILTILSQNTTDTNRDRAWRRLRAEFGSWDEVRGADRERLEAAIRVAGLAGQKARAIQGVLRDLHAARGEASLEHLREMADEEALAYLASFHGVGVKTAACVLCFSLGRPVLPVDTHVHRVAGRLGLAPADAGRDRVHEALNRDVPPELRRRLHLQLIRLGRAVCRARRPACARCPVEASCPKHGVEEEA